MSGPILVYARPWNARVFNSIAKFVADELNGSYVTVSEHSEVDRSGYLDGFLEGVRSCKNGVLDKSLVESLLTLDEVEDVIRRCRLLRSISRDEAIMNLTAAVYAIEAVLFRVKPSLFLSLTIDSYVIHLFAIMARKRGVLVVGVVPSFVKGLFRLSIQGSVDYKCPKHRVDKLERISSVLDTNYLPPFVDKGFGRRPWKMFKDLVVEWVRLSYYYAVRRANPVQYYNYHAWSTELLSAARVMLRAKNILSWWSLSGHVVEREMSRSVYVPLQYTPECTVDYWAGHECINYESRMLEVISAMASMRPVLVKEHPAAIGVRNPRFYNQLKSIRGVSMLDSGTSSNSLLEEVAAVLVCTGSVGCEAALRGVPVIALAEPYYYLDGRVFLVDGTVRVVDQMDAIEAFISSGHKGSLTSGELNSLAERHSLGTFSVQHDSKITTEQFQSCVQSVGRAVLAVVEQARAR